MNSFYYNFVIFYFQKNLNSQIPDLKEEVILLKSQLGDVKNVESQLKTNNNKIVELEQQIIKLTSQLEVCICVINNYIKIKYLKIIINV